MRILGVSEGVGRWGVEGIQERVKVWQVVRNIRLI
jgi:hypothetical protein